MLLISLDNATVGSFPIPRFADNEVLVEVLASSVNPVDYKIAEVCVFRVADHGGRGGCELTLLPESLSLLF